MVPLNTPERNVLELAELARAEGSGLVFFVGAGISMGPRSLPTTPALVGELVTAAVDRGASHEQLAPLPPEVGEVLGFELILNDLWQISQAAVAGFFEYLRSLDEAASPTLAHGFLGQWLSSGRPAITTNYDRLVERTHTGPVRFHKDALDETGFATWKHDLERGVLFKVHGSLQRPSSCLGAAS